MKFLWRSHFDRSKNPLGLLEIIFRFTAETLLTAAMYTVFVLVTIGLGYIERLDPDKNHKQVLEFLESIIFYSSSFIVLLVVVYLMIITAVEMSRTFGKTILEAFKTSGIPATSPPITTAENQADTEDQSEYSPFKFKRRLLTTLLLYILPLSLLIGVGCYQKRREQELREELKRQAEYSRHLHELSRQAIETAAQDFVTTCAKGNGVYNSSVKACIFPDGRKIVFGNLDLQNMR